MIHTTSVSSDLNDIFEEAKSASEAHFTTEEQAAHNERIRFARSLIVVLANKEAKRHSFHGVTSPINDNELTTLQMCLKRWRVSIRDHQRLPIPPKTELTQRRKTLLQQFEVYRTIKGQHARLFIKPLYTFSTADFAQDKLDHYSKVYQSSSLFDAFIDVVQSKYNVDLEMMYQYDNSLDPIYHEEAPRWKVTHPDLSLIAHHYEHDTGMDPEAFSTASSPRVKREHSVDSFIPLPPPPPPFPKHAGLIKIPMTSPPSFREIQYQQDNDFNAYESEGGATTYISDSEDEHEDWYHDELEAPSTPVQSTREPTPSITRSAQNITSPQSDHPSPYDDTPPSKKRCVQITTHQNAFTSPPQSPQDSPIIPQLPSTVTYIPPTNYTTTTTSTQITSPSYTEWDHVVTMQLKTVVDTLVGRLTHEEMVSLMQGYAREDLVKRFYHMSGAPEVLCVCVRGMLEEGRGVLKA